LISTDTDQLALIFIGRFIDLSGRLLIIRLQNDDLCDANTLFFLIRTFYLAAEAEPKTECSYLFHVLSLERSLACS